MPSVTMANGSVKDCCKNPQNLVESRPRPDLIVNTCSVCGCNHYRVHAETGALGAMLSALGKKAEK